MHADEEDPALADAQNGAAAEDEPAPAASDEGESAPPARLPWLRGSARGAATVALGVVIAVNAILVVRALEPKPPPDTTVRLRASGPPIPLYHTHDGRERIHWLKPGTRVDLPYGVSTRAPRFPIEVVVEIEEVGSVGGFVDGADIVSDDVERVLRMRRGE